MNVAARERQRWPKDYRIDKVDLEAEAQIRHSSLLLVMTLFPNVTKSSAAQNIENCGDPQRKRFSDYLAHRHYDGSK